MHGNHVLHIRLVEWLDAISGIDKISAVDPHALIRLSRFLGKGQSQKRVQFGPLAGLSPFASTAD